MSSKEFFTKNYSCKLQYNQFDDIRKCDSLKKDSFDYKLKEIVGLEHNKNLINQYARWKSRKLLCTKMMHHLNGFGLKISLDVGLIHQYYKWYKKEYKYLRI